MSASAAQSRSPSPKRKQQQPQQQQQQQLPRTGGIGVLSSPKFSFRAALVQHKASKLASKTAAAGSSASPSSVSQVEVQQQQQQQQPVIQPGSISRPIRTINNSSIPSLSGRGRLNSASTDSAFTSILPRRRDADTSPEKTRASSSLGKRHMEEASTLGQTGDSSVMSDFGPIMRKNAATAPVSGSSGSKASAAATSTRSRLATSKLPGPPSTRTQWNTAAASTKPLSSPSSSRAPRSKVARSDSVAEVHAASAQTTPSNDTTSPASAQSETRIGTNFGSVRSRTFSASARPTLPPQQQQQRPKIGTLPKPKSKTAPVKTLLDEKPIQQLRPALLGGTLAQQDDDLGSSDDDDDEDDDALEGPDVSRIRTRRVTSHRVDETCVLQGVDSAQGTMLPPAPSGSQATRIPSIGSSGAARTANRPQRRSSSNSVRAAFATSSNEKENISQMAAPPQPNSGSKRHSIAVPGRPRSSLPLAVSHPVPQAKAPSPYKTSSQTNTNAGAVDIEATQPVDNTPSSPTKTTSLSALRSRGLQTDSTKASKPGSTTDSALPPRSSKQDFGIRASIIQANPMHPSILALQAAKATHHQPISTPEALIKAKKRLSGALRSSSSSSSNLSTGGSTASPSERISSLAGSTSVNRFGSLRKMQSTPRSGAKQLDGPKPTSSATMTPSTSTLFMPRSGSRSPIKSSLLLFPTTAKDEAGGQQESAKGPASPALKLASTSVTGTVQAAFSQHDRVLSSTEIDANLLASLRVVAQKANLKVGDLMHEEKRQQHHQQQQLQHDAVENVSEPSRHDDVSTHARAQREASEELEALAGDVSVDLMALDLAASSPVSDMSMLRSPMLRDGGDYLDTPPSVLAAAAVAAPPQVINSELGITREDRADNDEEDTTTHIDDDETDTSCASPSLRAAAAQHLSRRPAVTVNESSTDAVETPVRRQGYRNVPSIPSTPFPTAASGHGMTPSRSARAYPPSAAMSAKTRSRLKKALRESLGLEAHFASIRMGAGNDLHDASSITADVAGVDLDHEGGLLVKATAANEDANVRKSISAMLLTEDDRYLDELVSAVARIGLDDLAPERIPTPQDQAELPSSPASPTAAKLESHAITPPLQPPASAELESQLSTALLELATLRTQLQLSQTQTLELEAQVAAQASSNARSARAQAVLETDLAALKAEMAGIEWGKAQSGWARARGEALAELEDAKVQRDAMLVLGAQMGVWERMIRARA